MAIINTLTKCLDSPYLFADASAKARVDALLSLAAERIEAASRLVGTDSADVVLFSYEAMFAAIRALVYSRGYREAGLGCLLLACEAFFVAPGRLDAALLLAFGRAQRLTIGPDEALAAARELAARATDLVARPAEPATPG